MCPMWRNPWRAARPPNPRRIRAVGILVLSCWLVFGSALGLQASADPGILTAQFINVGEGDSCWLHLPNGDDILVDGGKAWAGPAVVTFLRRHGVSHIDLLVATHGDADHIGGLLNVLGSMRVYTAWLDSQNCSTETCLDFYRSLGQHAVVTATVRAGQSARWGEVTALVLNPSEPPFAARNENSVALRISYGAIDFLLTGDAEVGAEARMLAGSLPLEAEILKVAHHGSDSSSSAEFLGAVRPREAIVSVGPNAYGHPSPETLRRLAQAGAEIWRTDGPIGSILVTTTGITYAIGVELPIPSRVFAPLAARGWGEEP